MAFPSPTVDPCLALRDYIGLCQSALKAGRLDEARSLATEMLCRARELNCREREAEAHYHLGVYNSNRSAFREGVECFETAAKMLHGLSAYGEAKSLGMLSAMYAHSGDYEKAVETGQRAQIIALQVDDPRPRFAVLNNVGVAYMYAGLYDDALACFRSANETAQSMAERIGLLRTRVNTACLAVIRAFYEQDFLGRSVDAQGLQEVVQECERLEAEFDASELMTLTASRIARGRALNLLGRHAEALQALQAAFVEVQSLKSPDQYAHCCMGLAEVFLAQGNDDQAAEHASKVLSLAETAGFTVILPIANRVLALIHERRGNVREALQAERAAFRAQQAETFRRTTLLAKAAAWRAELEQERIRVERLKQERQQLESLSLEDSLTGLKNRRFLESHLKVRLAGRRGFSVALIDVDRFKSINDTFSHLVGDQVLVQIAEAMTASLRDSDVAVRLAGDEFVIVVDNDSPKATQSLRRRLKRAIAGVDWSRLAPGLGPVSISIGFAAAKPGDGVDAILSTADRAMYANKRATHRRDAVAR